MSDDAKNENLSKQCPYCKEKIKKAAVVCKHCESSLPIDPTHGGTCPFCAETINVDAIKCKHCKSVLSNAQGDVATVGEVPEGAAFRSMASLPPIWEVPGEPGPRRCNVGCTGCDAFGYQTCTFRDPWSGRCISVRLKCAGTPATYS
ncbi:MAG: hypothetical protein ABW080_03630 [Candidatus Thiodiazotropha sp.]